MTRVLVIGATGFVGAALHGELLARGVPVVGTARNVDDAKRRFPGRAFVPVSLDDAAALRRALEGCSHAVYLVHSMASGSDYAATERAAAERVRDEAQAAGLRRLVYLGGMPPNGPPSAHLRSRLQVGEVLRAGAVETIELQASMVIGAGSASFRMVRDLAVRLPAMVMPAWSASRTEPIGIRDVVFALVQATLEVAGPSRALPLPGPEILTARAIIQRTAWLAGLRPVVISVPLLTPRLSSHWVRLVSRCDYHVAREIIEGLKVDIVAADQGFWSLVPHYCRQPIDDALREALAGEATMLSPSGRGVERVVRAISRPARAEAPAA